MDTANLVANAMAALIAFGFAAWKLPFARESALMSLLFGAFFVVAYLLTGTFSWFTGDPHYFLNRAMLAAVGAGLVAYSVVAFVFGRRLRG